MVSFAQDTTGYYNKILEKFKKEVVNVSFKDPYSFQLLSLKYVQTKAGEKLRNDINSDSLSQGYSFYSKKEKKEKLENMELNKDKLNKMSEEEKNSVLYYFVIIECRGANSYGNLIYSKYLGYYYDKTDKLDMMNIPR
jgi:hypothetical protein